MSKTLQSQPLTAAAFKPFGDVLECRDAPDKIINQGLCGRFHDRATLDFGPDGLFWGRILYAPVRTLYRFLAV